MGRLWLVLAAAVCLMATVGSDHPEYVDFADTNQNCDDPDYTVIDQCMDLYYVADDDNFWNWWDYLTTTEQFDSIGCQLTREALACVETALCHCNYSTDHPTHLQGQVQAAYLTYLHNSNSTNVNYHWCFNTTYGEAIDSEWHGLIEETPDINCTKYGYDTGNLPLVFSRANDPEVLSMAETCPSLGICYQTYDNEAADALDNQQYEDFCRSNEALVLCVINASCHCGQDDNQDFLDWVMQERDTLKDNCADGFYYPRVNGITCPGESGLFIHFEDTHQDCSQEEDTVVQQCLYLFYDAWDDLDWDDWLSYIPGAQYDSLICLMTREAIVCIETALCHCNYSSNHTTQTQGHLEITYLTHVHNNGTQCQHVEAVGMHSEQHGVVEETTDINCTKYGYDTGNLPLVFATANDPQVLSMAAMCQGMQTCYQTYDTHGADALYSQNYADFCKTSETLVDCLVSASCGCGLHENQTFEDWVDMERETLYYNCGGFFYYPTKYGIHCIGESGEFIDFEDTHQDCENHMESVIDECINLYIDRSWDHFFDYIFSAMPLSHYDEKSCQLRLEGIWCIETALCHCNYSANHTLHAQGHVAVTYLTYEHNNLSNCGNTSYGEAIDSEWHGLIEETPDINCTKFDKDTGNLPLVFATANDPMVLELAAQCEGFRTCYENYDTDAANAIYNQDFTHFCRMTDTLVECLVNASCDCGLSKNDTFVQWVDTEISGLKYACGDVFFYPYWNREGILCPGESFCDVDPMYDCLVEWNQADDAAGNNDTAVCVAEKQWAYCIEGLACECGFFNDTLYYHTIAVSKLYYDNDLQCVPLSGPFPDHPGIECSDPKWTDEEKFLSLSVEQIGFISAEEARCGVLSCYNHSLDDLNEAYRNKDLNEMCRLDSELFSCLEMKYCACGILKDPHYEQKMMEFRDMFYSYCTYFGADAQIASLNCPNCSSIYPLETCADELFEVEHSWYLDDYCLAELALVKCVEEVACVCGFYNQTDYLHSLAESKFWYHYNDCPQYSDPFPSHDGLNCTTADEDTELRHLLSVALSDTDFVQAEEDECPGIKQCHTDSVDDLTDAYNAKNLTAVCLAQEDRLQCVEGKWCDCAKMADNGTVDTILGKREDHYDSCFYVTGMMGATTCRDSSICSHEDPIVAVCDREYDWNWEKAQEADTDQHYCRAHLHYLRCVEDVACLCGILSNGSSSYAIHLHAWSMNFFKFYQEVGCHEALPTMVPEQEKIDCEGRPGDDVAAKLVLSFAESSEASALMSECYRVDKCFRRDDINRAEALTNRNLSHYCHVESDLIGCLDGAYCHCGMRDFDDVAQYMAELMDAHRDYCTDYDDPLDLDLCVRLEEELLGDCEEFGQCTMNVTQRMTEALLMKNYTTFCMEVWTFMGCASDQLCGCGIAASDNAHKYWTLQMDFYKEYCSQHLEFHKECPAVEKCLMDYYPKLDTPVCTAGRLCSDKSSMIQDCMDGAVCDCKKEGEPKAHQFRMIQVKEYDAVCPSPAPAIPEPKECKDTGGAGTVRLSALILVLLLLGWAMAWPDWP